MDDDTSGASLSSAAKTKASAAMGAVGHDAASLASGARAKAGEALDQHRQSLGNAISDFAAAIGHAGDELASRDQSMAGRIVKQAADGLQHLSRSLSDKRPAELADAARDFGRRNPIAFAAGGLLIGLALARLARSSGPDRANDDDPTGLGEVEPYATYAPTPAVPTEGLEADPGAPFGLAGGQDGMAPQTMPSGAPGAAPVTGAGVLP